MRTIRPISITSYIAVLIAIASALGLLNSCGGNQHAQASLPEITVKQLHDVLESGRDIFLLDVRTLPEYEAVRISETDKLIPYDKLSQNADQLPQDKDTEIFCICRTGRRSGIASKALTSMGYTNVHNVEGGMTAWQKYGYDVVNGPVSTP